jgi:hypothetical protein
MLSPTVGAVAAQYVANSSVQRLVWKMLKTRKNIATANMIIRQYAGLMPKYSCGT